MSTIIPHSEYPRPQFVRPEWLCLNGEWQFTFDFGKSGMARQFYNGKHEFEGVITVPFCPESLLSGVNYTDFIEQMWYRRTLNIPENWDAKRILLHFGGVDYEANIFIDGEHVARHVGGASSFAVDITNFVAPGGEHDFIIRVNDDLRSGLQPFGKQCKWFQSGGCSYTRTTGIYQSVWLEAVPQCALERCRIVPDFDGAGVLFTPEFSGNMPGSKWKITVKTPEKTVAQAVFFAESGVAQRLSLPDFRSWSPLDPFLYDVEYQVFDAAGKLTDQVSSYFGMRKISLYGNKILLNNQPIFLRMVLDQGFFPDGVWTPPDDLERKADIVRSQSLGFNAARLHQKIFDERFHYWADRLGYLTWAEFPDWGMGFWHNGKDTPANYNLTFRDYFAEWSNLVMRDLNHPSIIGWTPFNETNEYFDFAEHNRILVDVYNLTKMLDSTRPVNDSSGYVHAKTDLWTLHEYGQTAEEMTAKLKDLASHNFPEQAPAYHNQPVVVDEYGGIKYLLPGSKPFAENSWGYSLAVTPEEVLARLKELTDCLVDDHRISGYCYTQLTDVEQEENGLYSYQRILKFDQAKLSAILSRKPSWSAF